jgi:hypothetical protein
MEPDGDRIFQFVTMPEAICFTAATHPPASTSFYLPKFIADIPYHFLPMHLHRKNQDQ